MSKKTKKRLAIILVIIAVLAIIIIPQKISKTVSSDLAIANHTKNAPVYVAHRGLSAVEPQNTIPSFKAAVENGFYGYEFDIHTTSDGEWVVIHDDTIDKMTDGEGEVESYTLKELMEFNIDAGNGIENYENLKIPTLEETLAVCDGYDIIPVIEIKKCDVQYLPDFVQMLEDHDLLEKTVVISFTMEYLQALREINQDIETLYLINRPTKETVDLCIENGINGIDFYDLYLPLSLGAISYAKEMGLRLGVWTVDNTIAVDIFSAFGIKLITTNRIIP